MLADVVIRDAEGADEGVLREVFRRSSLANDRDRANLVAHPDVLVWVPTSRRQPRTRVAVVDDRVVGFATTAIGVEGLEVEDLFVDPDSMRRGVGRALVVDAVARARQLGIGRLTVTANDHALAFYQRSGFVTVGFAETQFGSAPRMHLELTDVADTTRDHARFRSD